jgi:hypothetical protein
MPGRLEPAAVSLRLSTVQQLYQEVGSESTVGDDTSTSVDLIPLPPSPRPLFGASTPRRPPPAAGGPLDPIWPSGLSIERRFGRTRQTCVTCVTSPSAGVPCHATHNSYEGTDLEGRQLMATALAAKYKIKMGGPSPGARPVSRESVTPPDEPAHRERSLPGAANLLDDKKKKRRKKKTDESEDTKVTALQMAMRNSQGMKGGTSVVRQFSMLQHGGAAAKTPAFAVASAEPQAGEDGEAQESNQRKALKELMIKFEHNQRQMAEAQRQLIEGKVRTHRAGIRCTTV